MVEVHNGSEYTTPLLYAISIGDLPAVKLLVTSGANVNKSVNRGHEIVSPLKSALGYPAIVQYLLQHGAKE